ncbi:DUF4440 domain-containing protein [Aliirhizobium terrae]|uniref:nuclear transport factor 2 family protein n=1 Tax=Terrirhizobium terrae TaxID=2926709 RepID=UPI0025788FD9|nr:DUF4440 domain-containing protein [Rhizobium sp. CC-CFT758]WJH40792.1 DUF4440 domain-containing protein [Rhizobium sp. CC-CFT758]
MQDLESHLFAREVALHAADVRNSEIRLRELLAEDFREFGRSGGRYDLSEIIASLTGEDAEAKVEVEDFKVARLGEIVALATYRSIRRREDGVQTATNRSSIWRLELDGSWRMVFHQGTPAA